MRLLALAPVLASALAAAATITIDDFTIAYTSTGDTTPDVLPGGGTREAWITPWGEGSGALSIGGGTAASSTTTGQAVRLDYSYYGNSLNLLSPGATAADSTVGLHVGTTTPGDVGVSVWFFNSAFETSAYWNFTVSGNSTALYTANLQTIGSEFFWDQVDFIRIEYISPDAGTITLGGDGNGFRVAAVPEPSTYGLMAGALALAAVAARRRRR